MPTHPQHPSRFWRATAPAALGHGLLAASLLLLAGCGGGGDHSAPLLPGTPPTTPNPPAPPAAAPTAISPGGTVSSTPTLTLEQQDGTSTAGAQISTSPNHTLISEGVSP